jgi:hypothetical protein
MNTYKSIIKRLFSYLKSNWDFDDYPIRTWSNPNAKQASVAFGAGIINWSTMVGHGETTAQAIEDLRVQFRLYRDNNDSLPRPGTNVPLKFASTEQIDKYEDIAVDFFKRALNMDYYDGFYSDGSILEYFSPPNDEGAKQMRKEIIRRTLLFYNIDITDDYDEPLYRIFEHIRKRRERAGS